MAKTTCCCSAAISKEKAKADMADLLHVSREMEE